MNKQIINSIEYLNDGGVILYPTDTVWGIGCDATNENAVSKVFEIKQRNESKSMIVLVDSIKMLQTIIKNIPEKTIDLISNSKRPTSIIYDNPIGLAKNVVAKDNTVAIRIVQDDFCEKLIHHFGKPIVSTSANISGAPTPTSFIEINNHIKNSVDYIVNYKKNEICNNSSKIIRITKDHNIIVIRK